MFYSLAQIVVIARGNDEGWMNILVLVVLAVVYGLGALIKAKGKQSEEQAQEPQTRRPQRKPSAGGRGILEQLFREIQQAAEGKPPQETRPSGQATRKQTARPQAAVRKYASQVKEAKQTQSISSPAKPKLSKSIPHVQSDFEILPELDTVIQSFPEFNNKGMAAEAVESSYFSEVLSDYEDPDELKRAILHYEILGKPLSLRDSSMDIIGL